MGFNLGTLFFWTALTALVVFIYRSAKVPARPADKTCERRDKRRRRKSNDFGVG